MDVGRLALSAVVVALGYLIGGIPWGVIVARAVGGPDPRTVGSGRTGGANVMRVLGPRLALLSGLLDMGKWGDQPCEVLEVEPEKLLRYTFAEGSLDSTITWRLEPEGAGTRLFLVHDGLEPGSESLLVMGRGWPGVLRRVEDAIT